MKIIITAILLFFSLAAEAADNKGKPFTLYLSIIGADNDTIYINPEKCYKNIIPSEILILKNNKASLSGILKEPVQYDIEFLFNKTTYLYSAFVYQGDTYCNINLKTGFQEIKGQWEEEIQQPIIKVYKNRFSRQYNYIDSVYRAAKAANNNNLADSMGMAYRKTDDTYFESCKKFILANKNTYCALNYAYGFSLRSDRCAEGIRLIKQLSLRIRQSTKGKYCLATLTKFCNEPNYPAGSTAPDFTIRLPDSSFLRRTDFKGKYVLLDFWGTWCKPCIENIPRLLAFRKKWDSTTVSMVSICYDTPDNTELMNTILQKNNINWLNYLDESAESNTNSISRLFHIKNFPKYVLMDKTTGKIIFNEMGEVGLVLINQWLVEQEDK
jgi:thiol-disulfide isomerase/thioredoxin